MAKATLAERRDRFVHTSRWRKVSTLQCYDKVRHLHPEDADVWRIPFNFSFWTHGSAYVFPTVLGWESSLHAAGINKVVYGTMIHDTEAEAKVSVFDALYGQDPVGLKRMEALDPRLGPKPVS